MSKLEDRLERWYLSDPVAAVITMFGPFALVAAVCALLLILAGCADQPAKPIIDTKVLDKPVPVRCQVELPRECLDRYAVDRLPTGADPVQVNRAIRAEVDERAACEVKLRAAVQGCNEPGR